MHHPFFGAFKPAAWTVLLSLLLALTACSSDAGEPSTTTQFAPPDWAVNATIYEVNVRQFSPEGTFEAFSEHIPRLREMGVEILWLMPIHPIGEKNRKGTLGSYYSIADYTGINPEFGTKDDFRQLVQTAHEHDMKVIIDWVANHTAWDAVWTETNPEFYETNEEGEFFPPVEDWSDVIQLDVESREMWQAMTDAMAYWVREYGIDGFRADVAYMVPNEFWIQARQALEQIKPVFMLAEADEPHLHEAFDMTYTWNLAQTMRDVGAGEATLADLHAALEHDFERYQKSDYRMVFTTNHDENSWKGSDPDLYGENVQPFAVFAATVWGMPLVYNGQESGLDKQLEFFEKDEIEWGTYRYEDFYRTLLHLNRDNPALFNGEAGGDFEKLRTDADDVIVAYKRTAGANQVLVVLNVDDEPRTVRFLDGAQGEWHDVFTGGSVNVSETLHIGANYFRVFERRE
ncbi:MAG: alpha-amylase family glycosyl hydrolase [Balneolaceae bacterium]